MVMIHPLNRICNSLLSPPVLPATTTVPVASGWCPSTLMMLCYFTLILLVSLPPLIALATVVRDRSSGGRDSLPRRWNRGCRVWGISSLWKTSPVSLMEYPLLSRSTVFICFVIGFLLIVIPSIIVACGICSIQLSHLFDWLCAWISTTSPATIGVLLCGGRVRRWCCFASIEAANISILVYLWEWVSTPQNVAALWTNASVGNEMLEVSFGNQVPLPQTPGFAIMCNLFLTNGGVLFQIIQKLLSKKGGSKGFVSTTRGCIQGGPLPYHCFAKLLSIFVVKAQAQQNK